MNKRSFKKLGLESSYEIYDRIEEYCKKMEPIRIPSSGLEDNWVFLGRNFGEAEEEIKSYLSDEPSVLFYDTDVEWECGVEHFVEDNIITEEEKELLVKDGYVYGDYIYIDSTGVRVKNLYEWLAKIPNDEQLAEGWIWVAFSIWTGSKLVTIRNSAFAKPKGRDLKRAIKQILRGEELGPDTGYEYY